jgi:hypothetical protein
MLEGGGDDKENGPEVRSKVEGVTKKAVQKYARRWRG